MVVRSRSVDCIPLAVSLVAPLVSPLGSEYQVVLLRYTNMSYLSDINKVDCLSPVNGRNADFPAEVLVASMVACTFLSQRNTAAVAGAVAGAGAAAVKPSERAEMRDSI